MGFVSFKVARYSMSIFLLCFCSKREERERERERESVEFVSSFFPTWSNGIHGFESRSISSTRFFRLLARWKLARRWSMNASDSRRNRYAMSRYPTLTQPRGWWLAHLRPARMMHCGPECGRTRGKKVKRRCFRGCFQPATFSPAPFVAPFFFLFS